MGLGDIPNSRGYRECSAWWLLFGMFPFSEPFSLPYASVNGKALYRSWPPNALVHPPGPLQRRGVARNKNAAPVGVQRLVRRAFATSTSNRRLNRGDVNLFHRHHRIERALGGSSVGTEDRIGQGDRRNLPRQSPFVLAPTARALLAAVADDRVPVAIRFSLVSGCNLKRERFVVVERRSAVEPEARNAHHDKLDGQHVPFLPRRKVSRCAVDRADGRIGKGPGVKPRRF